MLSMCRRMGRNLHLAFLVVSCKYSVKTMPELKAEAPVTV